MGRIGLLRAAQAQRVGRADGRAAAGERLADSPRSGAVRPAGRLGARPQAGWLPRVKCLPHGLPPLPPQRLADRLGTHRGRTQNRRPAAPEALRATMDHPKRPERTQPEGL